MTYQHHDTLVIVFGAGGRLGRALLPILAAGPWVVVAVARNEKPPDPPSTVHWIQIDVTEVSLWERSLRVFCGMAEIHDRVIIVDLLLDKSSVAAMRWSLTAGTAYIARLRSRLTAVNRPSSLVLASTTAVLAPWLYQTPYGLAKRRQLRRYASAIMAGQALLLPQLVNGEADPQTASARLMWTYADAATRVLRAVAAERRTEPAGLRLMTPRVDRPHLCVYSVSNFERKSRSNCEPRGTAFCQPAPRRNNRRGAPRILSTRRSWPSSAATTWCGSPSTTGRIGISAPIR